MASSRQPTPRTRHPKTSSSNANRLQEQQRPLATLEIVEKATAGVRGLTNQDALRVWKAFGSYVGTQLTQHRRAVKVDSLGIFALNAARDPIFLHNAGFLQTNRVREAKSAGKGVLQAIGNASEPIVSVNMGEIGRDFLQNYSKEVVTMVVTNVVALVGMLAKQGRVLHLSVLPMGEWFCDGERVGFKFLLEFQKELALLTRPSKKVAKTTCQQPGEDGDKADEPLAQAAAVRRDLGPRALSADALQVHAAAVGSSSQSATSFRTASSRNQARSVQDRTVISASTRGSSVSQRSKASLQSVQPTTTASSQKAREQSLNTPRSARARGFSDSSSARASESAASSKSTLKKIHAAPPRQAWAALSTADAEIVGRVKSKIIERCGDSGLNVLHQVLQSMDSSGDGKLSAKELKFGLRDLGVELSASELALLMQALDRNRDGSIDLSEFIEALRGPPLGGLRLALVCKAFSLMDSEGRGVISIDDMRENYDVNFFPSVRAKKKSKQQALTEFLRQWEENADGGRISLDAFIDYYHNVSACVTENSDFELMMRQTWHVSSSGHQDSGSGDDKNNQSASSSTSASGPVLNTQATLALSRAEVAGREKSSHGDIREEASPTYSDPEHAMLEHDWRYLQTLLIPTAGVHSNSKIPTVDDVSRRLGANRIWGDGNEVLQRKVFAHALTLLDKQLSTKEALLLAQRVALAATAMKNFTSDGVGGSIGLAALHRWLLSPCVPVAANDVGNSTSGQPSNNSNVVNRVRSRLLQRIAAQGNNTDPGAGAAEAAMVSHVGLNGLQRCLKLIDTNGDKRLSKDELKLGLRKFGVDVNFHELDYLFTHFDADRSGCIAMDEFLVGMRGEVNTRRLGFVRMAFDLLDKDHDGSVTLDELASAYDTTKHPDVLSGRMTAEQALRVFAAQWESEKERDGVITKHEFEEYYKNLSASIDSDDYFELMMRNAWHISGGEGVCANSTNRRVLVTKADQSQSVEEIKNDLGIKANDYDKMRENLVKQGVAVAHGGKQAIGLHGGYAEPPKDRPINRQAALVAASSSYNNSLEPPWQKKQSSKLQLQGKPNPKNQASQGRVFHRRRVLEMPENHRPDTAGSATSSRGGGGMFAKSIPDFTAATASSNALNPTQRREMERGTRQRAAQLIQNHFRGFKARKFVDCVRRKLAAERQREQHLLQAEQDSGRRKLVRPALKAYHGF